MKRSFDAEFINSVINHPDIYPWVARQIPIGEVDLGPLLLDARNVLLVNEGGGLFFHHLGNGLYEAHIQFLPGYRGKRVFEFANKAVKWLFENTDCQKLIGRIPVTHLGSKRVAIACGMRSTGQIFKDHGSSPNGFVDAEEYALTRERFMER